MQIHQRAHCVIYKCDQWVYVNIYNLYDVNYSQEKCIEGNEIATCYYCRDEDEGNMHTQKPLKICSQVLEETIC